MKKLLLLFLFLFIGCSSNEKSIVGFIAFLMMVVVMVADLITGWIGKDLVINEYIYDSFVIVVLGCFGIAGLEKFANRK